MPTCTCSLPHLTHQTCLPASAAWPAAPGAAAGCAALLRPPATALPQSAAAAAQEQRSQQALLAALPPWRGWPALWQQHKMRRQRPPWRRRRPGRLRRGCLRNGYRREGVGGGRRRGGGGLAPPPTARPTADPPFFVTEMVPRFTPEPGGLPACCCGLPSRPRAGDGAGGSDFRFRLAGARCTMGSSAAADLLRVLTMSRRSLAQRAAGARLCE